MLLQAALAATEATHPDYADLTAAVTRILAVADQVNESIRAAEAIQRVGTPTRPPRIGAASSDACLGPSGAQTVEVQNLLGTSLVGSLVHPSRFLVHVGYLHKISRHAVQRRCAAGKWGRPWGLCAADSPCRVASVRVSSSTTFSCMGDRRRRWRFGGTGTAQPRSWRPRRREPRHHARWRASSTRARWTWPPRG
jgi:hypothetical protein